MTSTTYRGSRSILDYRDQIVRVDRDEIRDDASDALEPQVMPRAPPDPAGGLRVNRGRGRRI